MLSLLVADKAGPSHGRISERFESRGLIAGSELSYHKGDDFAWVIPGGHPATLARQLE